ncbi:DUF3857 and transglutaminase domain-containing protein [Massilia sp. H6]|uniref:DUF3857 and transglutaminase domain-containing protein n=1 Tax=Massilia sp. H6 TaxID=2970464 RepID=UPI0021695CB6|nr:DUF3857 and transglutaminase domain-containing protein [Massilia sp. H6]UVW29139.1 DUF3857 and transglutaminase domain-containing protein [Massilia sp. H6]
MPFRLILVFLLLFATSTPVAGERFHQHFTVEADGSYLLEAELVQHIGSAAAIGLHAEQFVGFNASLDDVLAIEAWTAKADGRRVPVASYQIREQQEAASQQAPMFQDTRVKVVIFPAVAVGDTLHLRYRLRRHTPLFPGQFEHFTAAHRVPARDMRLSYDLPASMALHADAVGFEQEPGDSRPGRRRTSWRYVDGGNKRVEHGSVSHLDYGNRLAVTTFADYAALALAYSARAKAAAQPDAAIEQLAADIVQGILDPHARAIALSDWVRRNIRYVAVYLGRGGVVPHSAPAVLANRYGDCKDQAALLQALLAAAGMPASAALVNSGTAYRLPLVPTLGVLDHVIVYVPQLQLYLDPGAAGVAGGLLPPALLGKPVVLADSGAFAMTPVFQPARSRTLTRVDLAPDGSRRFQVTRSSGDADQHGVIEGFAQLPGPVALATAFHARDGLIDAVFKLGQEPRRQLDFVCPAIDAQHELRYRLPANTRVLALPQALVVDDGRFFYRSQYARRGATVVVKRRLQFRHTAATCTPQDYRVMRPALVRMMRDLEGQVLVQVQGR